MKIALAILIGGSAALAGCSSENSVRDQVRAQIASTCQNAPNRIPGVDQSQFCNCIADKAIENRSAAELRELTGERGRAAGAEAARQCLAQMGVGSSAAGTENASEAANEAANEAAPTENEGASEAE